MTSECEHLQVVWVYLAKRVIGFRQEFKVGLGDGGNALLNKAIRAHSNFSEYVPFTLVLILLVELQGTSFIAGLHVLGATLVLGRLLHAYGVSQEVEPFKFRVFGMVLTGLVVIIAALWGFFLAIT
ncbi:MAPEG family protein [Enterovibrio sp. ZSDZ35]|uniref:MAPEG family protein n=1 Tax=Enterovibrio qingdaonensis TaxID=2899818 RepID=A0ABT5QGQ3_9GAMM|nr:MAPEG family protein [Enterovibrio sp. ZSDZ35]MDD1779834.1 MAPEG family protein [Enterovibrio sp. ZSDZ35]